MQAVNWDDLREVLAVGRSGTFAAAGYLPADAGHKALDHAEAMELMTLSPCLRRPGSGQVRNSGFRPDDLAILLEVDDHRSLPRSALKLHTRVNHQYVVVLMDAPYGFDGPVSVAPHLAKQRRRLIAVQDIVGLVPGVLKIVIEKCHVSVDIVGCIAAAISVSISIVQLSTSVTGDEGRV